MDSFTYGLPLLLLLKLALCFKDLSRHLPPLPPPPRLGCTNFPTDSKCTYNVYCIDQIEYTIDTYYLQPIQNSYNQYDYPYNMNDNQRRFNCTDYTNYSGGYYSKINLRYVDNFPNNGFQIPKVSPNRGQQSLWLPIVVWLDLSSNDYSETPNLKEMDNLVSLNLSSNFLTTARLSDPNSILPALNEIDLSFNTIATIEIDQSQNVFRNLKKINISHNYMVEIPDSIFDVFTQLETLDLSFNYIDMLSISTFEGVKKLTGLFLSHNRISDLNYSLFRFSELTHLDLSHNHIVNLKLRDFEKLNKLVTIDISSNSIITIEPGTFNCMNVLMTVNLHNNKLNVIDKETFSNSSHLHTVDLSNNNFIVLPRGLFRGKNIRKFSINGNNLKDTLFKGTFEGLKLVTKLDLSHQHITSLEDYAFLGLDNVKVLFLNNNNIRAMSLNCFRALYNLNTLDLSGNNITDINFDVRDLVHLNSIMLKDNFLTQIKQENFKGLNSLLFMDLRNNKIAKFESNSFNSLRDLINFEISNNPLNGTLVEKTFDGLNSLPSLIISCTQLTAVNNGTFSGMTQLTSLNLSHSKISELQYNAFTETGALQLLDLSFNQLRTFDINATNLANVGVLLLNENLIKSITESSFFGLTRLTKINLAHNEIEKVHVEAFSGQINLEELDLSYNTEIKFDVSFIEKNKNINKFCLSGIKKDITFTSFQDNQLTDLEISYSGMTNITALNLKELPKLENVVLSNNQVIKLEVGAFTNISQLKELDISNNKIFYIQPGVFKDNIRLTILNISHNSLVTVSYGIFRGLIYLSTLDMSYNDITSLESERFYEVHSLSTLIVDHNRINSINIEDFAGTSLSTLSIGDNPLPCELLVNFKKNSPSFVITAIKLNEHIGENVDGVTCNMNGYTYKKKSNSSNSAESERVLNDIRELLIKIANKDKSVEYREPQNDNFQYLSKITDHINKIGEKNLEKLSTLYDSASLLVAQTNDTNLLLSKILISLNRKPAVITTPFPISKDNATNELIEIINKVKIDLENTIAAEKEDIMHEVDKIIKSVLKTEIHTTTDLSVPIQDKLLLPKNETHESDKSSMFTETCVALILAILVCLVLYKFYKSRMFVRTRRSYSTRELPGDMESQNL